MQSPSTFLFSYQTQMQEKLHLITNAVLHQCLATCFLHSCICRGRSRATALHRATRLRCDIFSPPLSSRQPSGHKRTCLTQLRSSKRPNISRVEVVFVCFFFFFSRVQLLGKGKKTLIIVLCLKFIPFLLLASL